MWLRPSGLSRYAVPKLERVGNVKSEAQGVRCEFETIPPSRNGFFVAAASSIRLGTYRRFMETDTQEPPGGDSDRRRVEEAEVI